VSRKGVPKRKAGIPLDELLAAHLAGDDRLADLQARYEGDVAPASMITPKSSTSQKRAKSVLKKAPGARFARPDDSQVHPTPKARLIGYARVSTDEQTTKLQLDALGGAGCAVIHEDSVSGASRSRIWPPATRWSSGGSTASDARCETCSIFPRCYASATLRCDR
jgi:hypothetical protein